MAEEGYLVRQGEGNLDLVGDGIGIASSLQRSLESSRWPIPGGHSSNTEGVHDRWENNGPLSLAKFELAACSDESGVSG